MLIAALAAAIVLADPFVIDGDTIGDAATGARYRVAGLDAPEIWSARCPAERKAGEAASAAAQRLIVRARAVEATPTGAMSGRRVVATIRIDGRDFAATMIGTGRARVWRHGQPGWCAAR